MATPAKKAAIRPAIDKLAMLAPLSPPPWLFPLAGLLDDELAGPLVDELAPPFEPVLLLLAEPVLFLQTTASGTSTPALPQILRANVTADF